MAVDPNIALQVQQLQVPDLVGNYTKMLQLKHLINQGKQDEASMEQQQQLKNLAAKHLKVDPTTGQQSFDEQGFISDLQGLNPMAANTYRKGSAEAGEASVKMTGEQLKVAKQRLDLMSNAYAGLLAKPGGATPQDVAQIFMSMAQQGIVDPNAAKQQLAQIPQDPAQVRGFLMQHAMQQMDASKRMELALGSPEMKEVGGQMMQFNVNKLTGEITPVKSLGLMPQSGQGKLETDITTGVIPTAQAGAYRKEAQTKGSTSVSIGGPGAPMDEDTLDMLAANYRKSGQLPSMGIGTKGAEFKMKVIQRAVKQAKAEGEILDPAAAGASYKADSGSLVSMQRNRDNLITFEKTALANLDQFLSLAKRMPDSGAAWANKPLRELARGAFGSEAQAAAQTALTVVRPEFAKINQGALTGVLSDSARKEVEETMPDNATLGQFLAAARVLKQDAANRHKFFDQGIQEIKDRMKTGGKPVEHQAPTQVNPANGKTYYLHPDGNYYLAPPK